MNLPGVNGDSAVAAWSVLAVLVFLYVFFYDWWAIVTKHRTMTNEFRVALHDPIAGPVIAGLWVALFVGLTFHFLISH